MKRPMQKTAVVPSSLLHVKMTLKNLTLALIVLSTSCSITAVRPTQEMSNMGVAVKAAKEVEADVLAPELYRLAVERSREARKEYQFKNFQAAKDLANQARVFAEKAEYESIRNGGKREALPQDPLAEPSYSPEAISPPSDIQPTLTPPPTPPEASATPFPTPPSENLIPSLIRKR